MKNVDEMTEHELTEFIHEKTVNIKKMNAELDKAKSAVDNVRRQMAYFKKRREGARVHALIVFASSFFSKYRELKNLDDNQLWNILAMDDEKMKAFGKAAGVIWHAHEKKVLNKENSDNV